jgi:HSP20 family protein
MREFDVVLPSESGDVGRDIDRLFRDLESSRGACALGECRPTLDVVETDESIQLIVDLPGVDRDAIRVLLRSDLIIVAGHKPRSDEHLKTVPHFHLVERVFGRFARAIRVEGAFDAARATAWLRGGELRVVLPKIEERRGRPILVAIDGDAPGTP